MSIQRTMKRSAWETADGSRTFHADWALCENGRELLSVEETADGKDVRLLLTGVLRSDTLHFFKDELMALATADADILLDCSGLTAISNSCQIGMIETQQLMDTIGRGTMTLVGLPPEILKDFQSTGVAGSLMIE